MNTEIAYLKKKVAAMSEVQESTLIVLSALMKILEAQKILDKDLLKTEIREGATDGLR
jgi:hypothetical protein